MKSFFRKSIYLSVFSLVSWAHAGSYEDFFRAVKSDNAGAVRTLIQRGFDPNTLDPSRQPGLVMALREPSPRVAKVLIEAPQTDVDIANGSNETPLMMAALKGQKAFVDQLLARDAAVNRPGWTPLHYAATTGQIEIMQVLLEKHAFIDAQSPNGTTPLMMAAMYGSIDAVKLLLDEGADPLMKNEQGMTAADFAQRANRSDAAELVAAAIRAKRPRSDGKW